MEVSKARRCCHRTCVGNDRLDAERGWSSRITLDKSSVKLSAIVTFEPQLWPQSQVKTFKLIKL